MEILIIAKIAHLNHVALNRKNNFALKKKIGTIPRHSKDESAVQFNEKFDDDSQKLRDLNELLFPKNRPL